MIVLGSAFGDEGKGLTTSFLCSITKNPLVVRFNGGHQAGHTVIHNGIRHVFSNFGSGTLDNTPTYWSEYCTVDPTGVIREGDSLNEKGIAPNIAFNGNAMVTTPFDIYSNQKRERDVNHGSVGVGFGTTITLSSLVDSGKSECKSACVSLITF